MKLKNFITSIQRYLKSLKRHSKKTNLQKLHERGETIDSFIFRDATEEDILELGKLHAITWAQTYSGKPNTQLRQYQWNKSFKEENDGSWFCILVVDKNSKLVGFAKGIISKNESSSEQHGDLNKIYLLSDYQRLGLGKKLFVHAVERFLSKGVNDMTLFGVPQNPSCAFHEAMGGERLYSEKGIFDGCYIWRDLEKLS
jgi:GNAT superfamily N-acetyltransferase